MMRITKHFCSILHRSHQLGAQRAFWTAVYVRPITPVRSPVEACMDVTCPSTKSLFHSHQLRWSSSANDATNTTESTTSSEPHSPPENADATTNEPDAATVDPTTDPPPEEEDAPTLEEPVVAAVVEAAPTLSAQHQKQLRELKDALMRSLAEQENTRTIARRDVEQARQFAIKSFAKSLLDVADNLQRALDAVPAEYRPNNEATITDHTPDPMHTTFMNLYEGIAMTEKGLKKSFESHGLLSFGAVGEPFDPNLHDALMDYDDQKSPHNTIGIVMKCGYKLHSRVLRPAEVGVILRKTDGSPPPPPEGVAANETTGTQ